MPRSSSSRTEPLLNSSDSSTVHPMPKGQIARYSTRSPVKSTTEQELTIPRRQIARYPSNKPYVRPMVCTKTARFSFAYLNNRNSVNNEAESDSGSDSDPDQPMPMPKPGQSEVEILRDHVTYLKRSMSSMRRKYEQKIETLNNKINDARRLEYGRELILRELETTSTRVFAQLRENASNISN